MPTYIKKINKQGQTLLRIKLDYLLLSQTILIKRHTILALRSTYNECFVLVLNFIYETLVYNRPEYIMCVVTYLCYFKGVLFKDVT
jgi:hypothetical protein